MKTHDQFLDELTAYFMVELKNAPEFAEKDAMLLAARAAAKKFTAIIEILGYHVHKKLPTVM